MLAIVRCSRRKLNRTYTSALDKLFIENISQQYLLFTNLFWSIGQASFYRHALVNRERFTFSFPTTFDWSLLCRASYFSRRCLQLMNFPSSSASSYTEFPFFFSCLLLYRWRKEGRCYRTCCQRKTSHRPENSAVSRTITARPRNYKRTPPWWARRLGNTRMPLKRWSSPPGSRIRSPAGSLRIRRRNNRETLDWSRARSTTEPPPLLPPEVRGSRPCTMLTEWPRTTASTVLTAMSAPLVASARTKSWTARSTLVWRGECECEVICQIRIKLRKKPYLSDTL